MLTDRQKQTAKQIVEIYENGAISTLSYGSISNDARDTGGLSYGTAQASLASGNLGQLVHDYLAAGGTIKELGAYTQRLLAKDRTLNSDRQLTQLLSLAGTDPIMQRTQDQFFEQGFWTPSVNIAKGWGFVLPLSVAVIYDSHIQGYWGPLASIISNSIVPNATNEQAWISLYVKTRSSWLENNANKFLRNTVYRMTGFQDLMTLGNWKLDLPIVMRGAVIAEPGANSTPRILKLTNPPMTGPDVGELQTQLNRLLATKFKPVDLDSSFGSQTNNAVLNLQTMLGLVVDGIVGPVTMARIRSKT